VDGIADFAGERGKGLIQDREHRQPHRDEAEVAPAEALVSRELGVVDTSLR
jgi:hypothetical protein